MCAVVQFVHGRKCNAKNKQNYDLFILLNAMSSQEKVVNANNIPIGWRVLYWFIATIPTVGLQDHNFFYYFLRDCLMLLLELTTMYKL